MLLDILAAVVCLAALTLVGLPYSLWLTGKEPAPSTPNLGVTIGLAPAFGIAWWSLLAPPLYLLLGPSQNWALFAALAMVTAGGVGTLVVLRKRGMQSVSRRDSLLCIGSMAICFSLLILPMISTGINSVIIRSNPSDVISYSTLGESTRTASFDLITNGSAFDSRPETAVFAEKNLSGVYSARFLKQGNARLATIVNLGWYGHLTGQGTHRLLWALGCVFSVAMAGAAFALARIASVGRALSLTASLAVGLGFWSAMVRDADALSNLQSNAILIALLALRVIDAHSSRRLWSINIASGVLLAAFISAYSELAPLVAGILVVEGLVRLLNSGRRWDGAIGMVVTFAVGAALIFASGQGPYLANLIARQLGVATTATAPIGGYLFESQAIANPIEGIAGLPWLKTLLSQAGVPSSVGSLITMLLGAATLLAGAGLGVAALIDKRWRHATPVAAAAAGGLLIACYGMFVQHDMYWFLKGMSSAGPIAMILVAVAGAALLSYRGAWRPVATTMAVTIASLLAVQISFAGIGVADSMSGKTPNYQARWIGGRSFDFSAMEAALKARCPCDLLVNIPPASDWWWAIMASMSLQEFKPYQQMGLFYDNKAATFQPSALERPRRPQFAVMAIEDDYVSERKLGELLIESSGLRLYRITSGSDADFAYRTIDPAELASPSPSPSSPGVTTPAVSPSPWSDIEHESEDVVTEGATSSPLAADRASLDHNRRVTHVFRETAVEPGDTISVSFFVWSAQPATLRSALFRHCNQDRPAPDIDIEDLVTTAVPQEVVLQTTFTVAYECIRVDVHNIGDSDTSIFLTPPNLEKLGVAPTLSPVPPQ